MALWGAAKIDNFLKLKKAKFFIKDSLNDYTINIHEDFTEKLPLSVISLTGRKSKTIAQIFSSGIEFPLILDIDIG